jgi:hypothetical protein
MVRLRRRSWRDGDDTLTLSDDGLTGDIMTNVSLMARSTNCVHQAKCSGTGT